MALGEHFGIHGVDQETARLLQLLAKHDREVKSAYHAVLQHLSALGWSASESLDDETATLMLAVRDNVSAFERAVEVGTHAVPSKNANLVARVLERLIVLEREAHGLLHRLRRVQTELDERLASQAARAAAR